jgi:hypothetical protein
MEKRHAQELAQLDTKKGKTGAEAVAIADSLYSVTLDGEPKGDGKVCHLFTIDSIFTTRSFY